MAGCLKDKVVIITGASSGIGLECARVFSREGASVVLAARSAVKLKDLEEELHGHPVLTVVTDVTVESDCKHLVEDTISRFGRIDILVNNAGLSMRALFKDLDLSVMKRLMDVNFWGCVYCTKYALPWLLESKGSVVGVTSIAGFRGLPGRTGYSASKFAMNGFLDTLRTEHLYDGLHVMTFAPGFTSSNVRVAALTADGTPQGATPRAEEKMMTARDVALYMLKGIRKRKNFVILTTIGKATVWISKFFPQFVSRLEYRVMAKEPDSPLSGAKQ
ncbi:MAG TPA: SDR family oxidoreductase [Bacteroidales bacterium]|jgi:short-subunit dehydrogenase|nr:SDR family oxidoreductase [Bacteroidales bacterium]OQC58086.1 MAG: putative oxidoreductase [Bacteroidetes bacterium ADurb.Bin013]MBV6456312.1 putative oxidoreductase [Bacteroidales bacterium]NLZ08771.1 SDR family oxidoreductase [Bacteroidales bacterium]HNW23069.1 SDR family oxidoreductase [Bacteroidales bacterium]